MASIGEKRAQSSWTLHAAIRLWQEWEVQQIDETTYVISGPGLGISEADPGTPGLELEEKLVTGEWTYHRDSGGIVPADKQSTALEKIISGKF